MNDENGVWRTICGRRVFIAKGQSLVEAMRASGKFSDKVVGAVDENENNEEKHSKKEERGQITEEQLSEFLGPEYKGLKGQAAVEKIASEKKGHVKGAFSREDIGDIDLFWGDENAGLRHIIERRTSQGVDADEYIKSITEVVENGTFGGPAKAPDSFIVRTNDKSAVIGYSFKGNEIQYVLTSFLSHGGGKGKKKPPK